uniref:Uncharacterized protein n=1 Tax=Utricularia reniformis TaxID=192314 RepID=A0A1Y0B0N9_9LAMI|nr:hypothetical protein AEK19_MT0769 [Utricularia reniformis]ART31012.1 hypothetical protein AEK19_MT0769 [Utricularia reniformis]
MNSNNSGCIEETKSLFSYSHTGYWLIGYENSCTGKSTNC